MITDFRNPINMRLTTENSGSAGILGELGGGWFIEEGVDQPFVTETDPTTNEPLKSKHLSRSSFGERAWSARWWASLVLHDFMATNWHQTTDPIMAKEWKNTENTTYSDITKLTKMVGQRASVIGEILSQDVEFNTDFMALLAITPGSHPNTYRVLHIASLIGLYAALYYKGLRNRPRPSQLCPALLPAIPMPGHASWPSGHATQAQLKALCMEHVLRGILPATPPTDDLGAVSSNLRALALRVARNREIAGLHYPTDSVAGRTLAATIAPFLTRMGEDTWFGKAVTAAKAEWRDGPAAH
jgi:membrane-associated phospholipid phosphatase